MFDRRDFMLAAAAAAPTLAMAQNLSAAELKLPPVPTAAPVPEGPLVTPAFAKFAAETRYEDLPAAVVEAVKWFLLDTVGCGLGGHALDKPKGPIALTRALGGSGARVLGSGERASPSAAAFANGELINALDFDCLPHSAAYVAAPVLAVAEAQQKSGRDVILALAIGLEVASRINRNVNTMGSVETTGLTPEVFGNSNEAIIGGAAGLASLMKLDATKAAHAIGLAAYYCAVPYCHDWEVRSPKSMVKYGPVGPSCQNAFNAAFLAGQGYTGDPLALDGPAGFTMFYERHQWDGARVLAGLGQEWAVTRNSYKPFAACKFVHSQIEAMTNLTKRTQLKPDQVKSIHSKCFPFVANLEMMNVRTQEDAQFSIPYVLAMTLHGIPLDARAYDWKRIHDPAIRATMSKISWSWHPDALTSRQNVTGSFLCTIDVDGGGQTFSETVVKAATLKTGEPMSAKFRSNAAVSLPPAKVERAHDAIMGVENITDTRTLMDQHVRT